MDDVIADLKIAEVGKKRRDFRLLALRAGCNQIGFVEKVACAKNCQPSLRQDKTVGEICFEQSGSEHIPSEIGGFVGITFAAASAATEAIGSVVLGEHVREALDFS